MSVDGSPDLLLDHPECVQVVVDQEDDGDDAEVDGDRRFPLPAVCAHGDGTDGKREDDRDEEGRQDCKDDVVGVEGACRFKIHRLENHRYKVHEYPYDEKCRDGLQGGDRSISFGLVPAEEVGEIEQEANQRVGDTDDE